MQCTSQRWLCDRRGPKYEACGAASVGAGETGEERRALPITRHLQVGIFTDWLRYLTGTKENNKVFNFVSVTVQPSVCF